MRSAPGSLGLPGWPMRWLRPRVVAPGGAFPLDVASVPVSLSGSYASMKAGSPGLWPAAIALSSSVARNGQQMFGGSEKGSLVLTVIIDHVLAVCTQVKDVSSNSRRSQSQQMSAPWTKVAPITLKTFLAATIVTARLLRFPLNRPISISLSFSC